MSGVKGNIPIYETEDVEEETPDYAKMTRGDHKQSDDIVDMTTKPQLAFERFAGAIYDTSSADLHNSVKIRQLSADKEFFGTASLKKGAAKFQSPLQRYTQLKNEVNEFMEDLKDLAKELKSSKDPSNAMPHEATELLSQQIATMKQQLSSIENDDEQKLLLQATFPVNTDLLKQQAVTDQLSAQLASLSKKKEEEGKTTTTGPTGGGGAMDGRIQYELYCQPDKGTTHLAGIKELDKRIGSLEKIVGQKKRVVGVKFPDIYSAVQYLKTRMELLDKHKLDSISRRVERLLIDLKRLSQRVSDASGGLTASSSEIKSPRTPRSPSSSDSIRGGATSFSGDQLPTRDEILEHHQKVNTVYGMLSRFQETSEQLPLIIERLKSLRALHEHSATAMSRLSKLEQQQATLDTILKQNQQMLSRMENSFATNMKTMINNTKILEEKFAKLSSRN
mmetsp:Transcript_33452/g.54354  ORF Transcript_33452/g.54354 Transcript_33452/m.54354 type:complete len:449 (-) Transcript_33452:165-1511(-)